MTKRLLAAWDVIRAGLWLWPSLMILVCAALAAALLRADAGRGVEDSLEAWWLHSGDAANARDLLSTLLSAIITMASLVFSITVVALSLAANQFGSRIIRSFRADRRTQLTLGLFAGTIVYCLLVLRTIQGDAPAPQVPHMSVTVGTALSLGCVLALLAFIQGVARSIVGDEVATRVGRELNAAVDQLPPLSEPREERPSESLPADFAARATPVALPREGYVQAIDYDGAAGLGGGSQGCGAARLPRRRLCRGRRPAHLRAPASCGGAGGGRRDLQLRHRRPRAHADAGCRVRRAAPCRGRRARAVPRHE